MIIFISVCLSIILIVWTSIHIVEYWRMKNAWTIPTILIFLSAFITIDYGIFILVFKSHADGYLVWKYFRILGYSLFLTGVGLIVRMVLRLTNRIKLDKKKSSIFTITHIF